MIVLAAISVSLTPAVPDRPYIVSPALPSWVEPIEIEAGSPPDETHLGTREILWDRQVRVTSDSSSSFYRTVRHLRTHEGVQENSSVEIDVDPEYEHIVLHRVDLIRDGRVVDALANATVRVVQQEEELERQIYNGELTVSVVLEDVRPGDVLDYAWTVEGEHPALRGHLATYGWLAGFEPVDTIRFRVLWPKDRSVDWKTLAVRREPRSRELGDSLEYTWLVKRPDPVEWEERAPQDHPQLPLALVSSFKDWASVSRWAAENYSSGSTGPRNTM